MKRLRRPGKDALDWFRNVGPRYDPQTKDVDLVDVIQSDDTGDILPKLLSVVGQRNASILIYRHAQGLTLEAIGDIYGLSRQRVLQIVNESGAKVRAFGERCYASALR